jgi:dTDP-4-dehydrorhamnose reductase
MEANLYPMSNKKIIVTGGSGRFGEVLKKNCKKNFIFPKKSELNILQFNKMLKYLKKKKPKSVIHLAGLSRPMSLHENNISKSISLNIIGTSNLTIACERLKIKLIYFSSSYVYPGTRGNYKEIDPLLPCNNYAWSKLGGECAVQMYKNSLILRVSMTEKPFIHKHAFTNMKSNFIFHEDFIKIFFKILNKTGIINIGGPTASIYDFAKKNNPNVKKKKLTNLHLPKMPFNASMSLNKLKTIIK